MSCDHLLCQAVGSSCELEYGISPEGVFDKFSESPPEERLAQLERELAAIDLEALRTVVRAEHARRVCKQILEEIVEREKYELGQTHDPRVRARRETKLLARVRALRI